MKKDVIQALMDGKQVQFREIFGFKSDELKEWTDLDINNQTELYASLFTDDEGYVWRIKPSTTMMLYAKTALMLNENGYYTQQVHNEHEERELETQCIYFRKWLTGWINYLF